MNHFIRNFCWGSVLRSEYMHHQLYISPPPPPPTHTHTHPHTPHILPHPSSDMQTKLPLLKMLGWYFQTVPSTMKTTQRFVWAVKLPISYITIVVWSHTIPHPPLNHHDMHTYKHRLVWQVTVWKPSLRSVGQSWHKNVRDCISTVAFCTHISSAVSLCIS